jgi:hypothetical protein
VPSVRALDDPAPRLSSNAPDERSLAPTTDVRRDAARSDGGLDIRVVVTLVEAQMLGTSWAARTAEHNCVERIADQPFVVDVGAGDLSRNRHSATICEHVAFDAPLWRDRSGWDRSGPPFGGLHDRTVQRRPLPLDPASLVVVPKHLCEDR